jgi:hypothetical protein
VILDLLLWLPAKLLKPVLEPVTAMLDSLAEGTEAAAQEFGEIHGL